MVTSTLGLYYQNLESTVEVYIKDWVNKGYDEETLKLLSFYCYKQDIRNLSLMNEVINKFYKQFINKTTSFILLLTNPFSCAIMKSQVPQFIKGDLR